MKISLFFLLFFSYFAFSPAQSSPPNHVLDRSLNSIFDVVKYGAIGDGRTNDTRAFEEAWKDACESSSSSTMLVPSGKNFSLSPIAFEGPCKAENITVEINGIIVTVGAVERWQCHRNNCDEWLKFSKVTGLSIVGSGMIDGQGSNWWDQCDSHKGCYSRPTALKIKKCDDLSIKNLTFINSPKMHIVILESNWVGVSNIKIKAPGHSPNTDGIHIQRSTNVYVDHSQIGTGDDCISIGEESFNIHIWEIQCGPGHGISIGSLGKNGEEAHVGNITVNDVAFTGTSNGVRIKTWQGGKGYARNITFQNVNFKDVRNPIIIDQYYCDHTDCTIQTSAVEVSNVTYREMRGTSAKEAAVIFACSKTVPCTDIVVDNIQIVASGHRRHNQDVGTTSSCQNAHGIGHRQVIPTIPCLGYS